MTTTQSPESPLGADRAGLMPPGDEPVVMHDEFEQLLTDATESFRAVVVLSALLRGVSPDSLDAGDRVGLAVLLEGVRHRLELTVDGLGATASALGIDVDRMVLQ